MNELISIIVPVYNAEKTLERCVSALIGQTYQNIEIILVDDGSKDNSLAICRRFAAKDDRIRIIDKPNGGVSSARNAGLDIARGEFVMFCDSDDWAEPDWCEELISHYEDGCLVMCGHYVEGGTSCLPHEIRAEVREIYSYTNLLQLRPKFFTCPWNKIYVSEIIRKHSLRFDERLSNGEDYLFNLQYIVKLNGRIIRLTKCVFHYEWPNGNTLSTSIPENYFTQLQILYHGILKELHTLGIREENGLRDVYADLFHQYEKGILGELNSDKPLSVCVRKVNNVMKTPEYQCCISGSGIASNASSRILWKQKNCYIILLWNWIANLRRKGR